MAFFITFGMLLLVGIDGLLEVATRKHRGLSDGAAIRRRLIYRFSMWIAESFTKDDEEPKEFFVTNRGSPKEEFLIGIAAIIFLMVVPLLAIYVLLVYWDWILLFCAIYTISILLTIAVLQI